MLARCCVACSQCKQVMDLLLVVDEGAIYSLKMRNGAVQSYHLLPIAQEGVGGYAPRSYPSILSLACSSGLPFDH